MEDYSLWTIEDEENLMTTFIIIAGNAILIHGYLCEHRCGTRMHYVNVLSRLIYRHVSLALKLFIGLIWFLFGMFAIIGMVEKSHKGTGAGGPETERLAGFINHVSYPAQMIVDGFINILGLIAVGVIFGLDWLKTSVQNNPNSYIAAAIITYLVWLALAILDIVSDEFESAQSAQKSKTYPISAFTFVLWIAFVLSAPYVFGFVAHKVAIHVSQASVPASCVGHIGETDPICVVDGDMYITLADGDIQRFPTVPLGKGWEIAPASDPRWFEIDTSAFATSVNRCRYVTCPSKP